MGETEVFRTGGKGGLGVSGCSAWFMVIVLGGLPLAAIVFTLGLWSEAPVMMTIAYVIFCFPLAMLYVIKRLMTRYALAVERDGAVVITYPFKTLRLGPNDIASVTSQAGHLGYNQGMAIRRPDMLFVRADNSIAARVAVSAFSTQQWQDFLAALQRMKPDLRIG